MCVVVKSSNADRIAENNAVWDWKLSEEDLERFSEIKPQTRVLATAWCNNTTSPYKSVEELWDGEC